ncbi:MAG: hypothetical protein ACFFDF_02420 [Candidatus Odinarchaeota archaeon]
MPYIITYLWFPPRLSDAAAQRYLETIQKYPLISSIKRVIPAAIAGEKEGIEVMVIDEVKTKDLGEALAYIGKFVVEFRNIEGITYETRVVNTLNEAMGLIGKG